MISCLGTKTFSFSSVHPRQILEIRSPKKTFCLSIRLTKINHECHYSWFGLFLILILLPHNLLLMTNIMLKIISPYTFSQYVTILFFMHKTTSFRAPAMVEVEKGEKFFVFSWKYLVIEILLFLDTHETERVELDGLVEGGKMGTTTNMVFNSRSTCFMINR